MNGTWLKFEKRQQTLLVNIPNITPVTKRGNVFEKEINLTISITNMMTWKFSTFDGTSWRCGSMINVNHTTKTLKCKNMIVTNDEKKLLLNRLNSDATNQNQRSKTSSMSDILAGMTYASKTKEHHAWNENACNTFNPHQFRHLLKQTTFKHKYDKYKQNSNTIYSLYYTSSPMNSFFCVSKILFPAQQKTQPTTSPIPIPTGRILLPLFRGFRFSGLRRLKPQRMCRRKC